MVKKSGLGKGLDALIPSSGKIGSSQTGETTQGEGINQLDIDLIHPNPRQPRNRFDSNELEDLAASIKEHGVLQPLLITKQNETGQFFLIAGERRLLAARLAGLRTVPVILRDVTEQERVELALIENIQRADLSPLETSEAYRQLAEEFHLSHEQIAERVGKSRVSITNKLRLLKLPASIQQNLAENKISEGHARVLLALSSHQAQLAALQTILKNELTVRQTEELVRKLTGQRPTQSNKKTLAPQYLEIEERLRENLGTKVTLNHRQKGGTLVIHYYSEEELDTLVNRILQNT